MKNYFVILVLLFLTVFISGCISILPTLEEESITPVKGRLEIYLADLSEKYKANVSENYLAVNITIYKIQVHLAGDGEEDGREWIEWILTEPTEYNLIELKDKSILLSEEELIPGKYTQIRLFITESTISVEIEVLEEKNDKEIDVVNEVPFEIFDVEIPSVYQTGIKLIHPFEINEGETTELTIDFDAEESIVKTGNGNYKLKPVIKIITVFTNENGD